jgi:hypothetical protein
MGVQVASLISQFCRKAINSLKCLVATAYRIEAIYRRLRSQVGIEVLESLCGRILLHKYSTLYVSHYDTSLGREES